MNHGRHIQVMGKGASSQLGDVERVRTFLADLVTALGMRALGSPVMHDVAIDLAKLDILPFEDEGGVTGTVVLSTSHAAIHTWPVRHFFILDVFSCRDFAPKVVELALAHSFTAYAMKSLDVDMTYPDD